MPWHGKCCVGFPAFSIVARTWHGLCFAYGKRESSRDSHKQTNRKTNMKSKIETIKAAIQYAGTYPFRHESGYPDYDAQRNLQGRTHFADPETLRAFKSRILDASVSHDGLVYWLIESNRSKPFELEKNKRFVAFDVFGTQLFERDSWHKTSKAAFKEGKEWLSSFNAVEHTESALKAKATRDSENAKAIFNTLAGI